MINKEILHSNLNQIINTIWHYTIYTKEVDNLLKVLIQIRNHLNPTKDGTYPQNNIPTII